MAKQLLITIQDLNNNIETYISDNNLKTRNGAGPGLWVSILLPVAVVHGVWNHPECTLLYKTCSCISFGLLVSTVLIVLPIAKTTKYKTVCCVINSALTTLLLTWVSNREILFNICCGVLSSFGYNRLLMLALHNCPESFTFGEAAVIVQGAILLTLTCLANLCSETPSECMQIATVILQVGVLGLCIICTTAFYTPNLRTPTNFYLLTGFILLVVVTVLHYVLQASPVLWILCLLAENLTTVKLLLSWIAFSVLAVSAVAFQVKGQKKASTVVRKTFHLLALAVYVPGLILHLCLLYTASGIVFALFVALETLRLLKLPPLADALNSGFQAFADEKDKSVALTPLYLMAGCSLPLWLHPVPSTQVLLPLLAGLLSVGVGDTAASMCGTWCGKHKWPGSEKTKEGTAACFLSQLFVVIALIHFNYIPRTDLLQPTLAIAVTSIVEAITDQVDNIALPLLMYILLL